MVSSGSSCNAMGADKGLAMFEMKVQLENGDIGSVFTPVCKGSVVTIEVENDKGEKKKVTGRIVQVLVED